MFPQARFSSWRIMIIFTGTVLFLEEDHFVSEDFLYVLNLMHQQALAMPENKVIQTITITTTMLYPEVDILCLGTISIAITINLLKYSQVDILCLGTYLRKFNPKATQKQVCIVSS